MNEKIGLAHFWAQGDAVTHGIAILLALLSIASWTIIAGKAIAHLRFRRSWMPALSAFWGAPTVARAVEAVSAEDRTKLFANLAVTGVAAADGHARNAERGIGAGVDASEFITRALRMRLAHSQSEIERGLTFLASVGSTAPFIGLFGTVWGIYHALVGLTGSSQVVLDKVAGPVGEALVMTAAGLFVAIPAVLAYNAFVRGNRLAMAQLDGFAHDLHAYLTTGVRLGEGDLRLAASEGRPAVVHASRS